MGENVVFCGWAKKGKRNTYCIIWSWKILEGYLLQLASDLEIDIWGVYRAEVLRMQTCGA